ncbi:MAG: NFYB/HAP3 family transcription factor subunit [Candidatus Euphemobacter frigidus]|jgi:histone H3/H4|nr:NFYB/HAP3 family transcription factor subunit [Candidatus Euphemobacter frigidus]
MDGQSNYIKNSVIKRYISDQEDLRSSEDAIAAINQRINELIQKVIEEAAANTRDNDRKTVLQEDAEAALQKHVGRETLTWQQTLDQVLRQPPVNLRDIANGIDEELKRLKL